MMVPEQPETVIMFGPSKSGKTNIIATLLVEPWLDELREGGDGHSVEAPSIEWASVPGADPDTARNLGAQLARHRKAMLQARDIDLAGTESVTEYGLNVSWRNPAPLSRKGIPATEHRTVTLVDGRGGAIGYEDPPDRNDELYDQYDRYKREAVRSSGLLLCISLLPDGFNVTALHNMLRELGHVLQLQEQAEDLRLKRISICFTKYEAKFVHFGVEAHRAALDPDSFRKLLKQGNYATLLDGVMKRAQQSDAVGGDLSVALFPVSTYGFIHPTGQANFYPWKEREGLLTRAIRPDDYDDPDRRDLKDHFPVPLSEPRAAGLWRPFNVAPAFFHAVTGRLTGPLVLDARETL
ncbi:MAG: hypothetical protein AAF677_01220 [Pseudomonadota bacterium]